MQQLKLFMLLLGCKPQGRHTEQHDIFFGIAPSLRDLVPAFTAFWPDAGKIHIDAWREVTGVDGYAVTVTDKRSLNDTGENTPKLFFLNLGGYKEQEFEEYHYKILAVAAEKSDAIKQAKQTAFYKHCHFKGADSHIDDKYGVDVDDIYQIADILPDEMKEKYSLVLTPATGIMEDAWHLGYTKVSTLLQSESGADKVNSDK